MSIMEGVRKNVYVDIFGGPAVTNSIHAAIYPGISAPAVVTTGIKNPPFPSRITATVAATTASHIKNVQVIIAGKNPAGVAISETLPAFTDDTPGTVTGVKVFKEITQITVPAMDGASANVVIGNGGAPIAADANDILAAVTDNGTTQVFTGAQINQPDVPRNITATAGGTAGDIKAIQVTVTGRAADGSVITEDLPAFTVDTPGVVTGVKAFKTITSISIPAHDGNGATTAIGFGDVLGLSRARPGKTVMAAYLADVIEGTAPTEVADADEVEKNTVDLNSALNGTQVKVQYVA